jgi:hypothetical protein
MARFKAQISLDHIHCYKQPEISGSEPYLLTAFFKIDGDTIVVDLGASGFFLNGPCTFVGTAGSHGNLGDTCMRPIQDVCRGSADDRRVRWLLQHREDAFVSGLSDAE